MAHEFINTIDPKLMREQLEKLSVLLDYIHSLDYGGCDFDGIEIDNDGIILKSSTYFSGCGTDTFSRPIKWEELDKPLSYWTEMFKRERIEEEDEKRKRKEEEQKSIDQREKAELERLLKKWG